MASKLVTSIIKTGGWLIAIPLLLLGWSSGAEWTFGVYICADNGMSEQAYDDIAELMAVGSSDEVKVVIQVDFANRDTNPTCRRFFVHRNHLELLANLGEVDMADSATLADFIGFLGERFPAKRFFLVLWDHGNGWRAGYGPDRAILIDESAGHMMGVAGGELRRALAAGKTKLGKRLEVLAFDACLMGSVEVATEVLGICDFLLASEGVVEWDGFPYDRFLARLVAHPTALAEEFLPEMCADYVASFPGEDVCLSALRMQQLPRVLTALRNAIRDSVTVQAPGLQLARFGVQTFAENGVSPPSREDETVDLIHFWELAPQQGTGALRSSFHPLVVANATGGNYGSARGVSLWFPFSYLRFKGKTTEYQGLAFADSVPWLRFLNDYFGKDDVKPTTPEIIGARLGKNGALRLWWSRADDLTPVRYHLYQTQLPRTAFFDPAENLSNWESAGWTLSTRYRHSQNLSFFSGSVSNLNNTLTLTTPIALTNGGLLSFYALFNTEESEDSTGKIQRDVCYVDHSSDRQQWETLDSLYGSGETWQEYRYLLPPAERTFLRFRYLTNGENNRLGVFIDDITVQDFGLLHRSLSTTETTAVLFNLARDTLGHYFFLVAEDSAGNRSSISRLYGVKIATWAEPYTRPAPFSGPCDLVLDHPAEKPVTVRIYTLSGTLVREWQNVQEKIIPWDGKNQAGKELADGVYIVLVQGKEFKKLGRIARVKIR